VEVALADDRAAEIYEGLRRVRGVVPAQSEAAEEVQEAGSGVAHDNGLGRGEVAGELAERDLR